MLGLVAYAFILLTAFVQERARAGRRGDRRRSPASLFAAWLLYAQIALIHAICQWCVASDVVISLLAVFTVLRAIERDPAPPA